MAFDKWGYISSIVGQLNLDNMDSARQARLKHLKDDLKLATPDQQSWEPGAPLKSPEEFNGGAPLNETDWADLYETMQKTFAEIKADKELMADGKVAGLVTKFYDFGEAIEPVEYTDALDDAAKGEIAALIGNPTIQDILSVERGVQEEDIQTLKDSLTHNKPYYRSPKQVATLRAVLSAIRNDELGEIPNFLLTQPISASDSREIANYINDNLTQIASITGMKDTDLQTLADGLQNNTYYTNIDLLDKLRDLLMHLNPGSGLPTPVPTCLKDNSSNDFDQNKITQVFQAVDNHMQSGGSLDMNKWGDISKNLKQKKALDATQADKFKAAIPEIFTAASQNDKIADAIKSKSSFELRNSINKGLDKTNYKDGKNVLQPLHSDRKRFYNNAKSKISGMYTDSLGKLSEKHTRHIYSTNAKYIVAGLIKEGVKPTDGTKKILESLDKISADLPSPVQQQMKWIKSTFQELSSTTQFKEALSDGHQLRTLVQDIIIKAAESGKDEDVASAKVALEMLAVMRYTMTTSSVRDKLHGADFAIFSDPNLSFNKGPFKHLTAALDKTLRFGMLAAFEIGNLAKNTIRTAGTKIGKGEGNLSKDTKKTMESLDETKADDLKQKHTMQELFAFWDFVNTSSTSKDYMIFRSHKNRQKKADKEQTGTSVTNRMSGQSISNPTAQEKRFIEWMNANKIGRAA